MSTSKAEVLPAGEQSDDEWESYIRDASIENTFIEHGKRWLEFFESCQSEHSKQGGSNFRAFAEERFGFSKSLAYLWVDIGRGAEELSINVGKFAPDLNAMAQFLRLSEDQKRLLLNSDELISRKTIKALKDASADPSDDDEPAAVDYDDDDEDEADTEQEISERGWLYRAHMAAQGARYAPIETCPNTDEMRAAIESVISTWRDVLLTLAVGTKQ